MEDGLEKGQAPEAEKSGRRLQTQSQHWLQILVLLFNA